MGTLTTQKTRQNILMVLDKLPPESLSIVEQFVNFLQAQIAKTQEHQTTKQTSGLGGLWQDVDLDIDVQDIRQLRRESTQIINRQLERYDSTC
jgi:hypothetical protein